jgi:hypothetical protein
MTDTDGAREAGARRHATRLGLVLRKSRTRFPEAVHYGAYFIVNPDNVIVAGGYDPMDLNDVEQWLGEASEG